MKQEKMICYLCGGENHIKIVEVGVKDIVKRMTPKEKQVEWLTDEEAAKHLKISKPILHSWTVEHNSKLKSYRLNGSIYYKLHELDAALEPRDFNYYKK